MKRRCQLALIAASAAAACQAQTPGAEVFLESDILTDAVDLTSASRFSRAGESYFSADGRRIIFQATPAAPAGQEPGPHYEMYAAELETDALGGPVGLIGLTRLSAPGSANTCGWFDPRDSSRVLFATTRVPPREEDQPGYQRESGRYRWAFPVEMEIVTARWSPGQGIIGEPGVLFEREGYTAECSYSPDARHVLYAQVMPEKSAALGRTDADLFVYDTARGSHTPLVTADGYDGGPFFSPDGAWICYRSDRRGDNLLQLFIAELARDDPADPGRITGIRREIALTDNRHVNWAPSWHPSGRLLIYSTSEVSHSNYEVFAVGVFDESGGLIQSPRPVRLTYAEGFDGLPVFSPDGSLMMWTAQRGEPGPDGRASSQIRVARVNEVALMSRVFGPGAGVGGVGGVDR